MPGLLFILLGLCTGIFSGLVGLGGGALLIPALIYLFGFTQHQAQGTTLAIMVPPIGLLAAWVYFKQGHVDIKTTAFIISGFFIGGYLGAKLAIYIPEQVLSRVFGGFLAIVGIKMLF